MCFFGLWSNLVTVIPFTNTNIQLNLAERMSLIYRICLNLTVCSSLQWDTWFCWAGEGRAPLPEMASPRSASAGVARSSSWHGLCCRGLQTRGAAVSARSWAGQGLVSPAGCWFSSPGLLYAGMLAAEPMEKYILKHPDFSPWSLYLFVLHSYFRITEKKTQHFASCEVLVVHVVA